MYAIVDANARHEAHNAQILKEHGFIPWITNFSVCARGTRCSTARSRSQPHAGDAHS